MTTFTSAEFIALAAELMADGATAVLSHGGGGTFDPATLRVVGANPDENNIKLVFISPRSSAQTPFEREIFSEDFTENKYAITSYLGPIDTQDVVDVTGLGTYTVTGVSAITTLGTVIYQRMKLSR